MPRILYFFALCNLVIGSGAFVLTGILQPMALELGIHIAAAGQVMTAYAIATAVLAPLLILLTAKWPRKRAIQLGLGLFAAGNLVSALSASLALLLMGRVLMGAGAMFTAAVAAYAVTLVAPALRGRALSTVFLGMSISYAVALPIGAWLGFEYGWHTPVWLCAAASLAALLAASVLLPKGVVTESASLAGFRSAARQSAVLRVWLRTLLFFIAVFSVFAYVGPVLLALNAMSPALLSVVLAIFGLAGVAGTLLGGWATDRFGPLCPLPDRPCTAGCLPAHTPDLGARLRRQCAGVCHRWVVCVCTATALISRLAICSGHSQARIHWSNRTFHT